MTADRGAAPPGDAPHLLLVNPWIHDFAAYDFWAAPLGILTLAGLLRRAGYRVTFIDCLDRFHPRMPPGAVQDRGGRGPYRKTPLPTPLRLNDVPRRFSRYGIDPDWLREDLGALGRVDLVLLTSLMTYWYPGVRETVEVLRERLPDTPIVLGGIYATLCPDHARTAVGVDAVIPGGDLPAILETVAARTGSGRRPAIDPDDLDSLPYPALDLQRRLAYIPVLTSRGCPFACSYCASRLLAPRRLLRDPRAVADEIEYWHRTRGAIDVAFYDDALLVDAHRLIRPLLQDLVERGLRLRCHTPNAVHVRALTPELARWMHRAGFETVRLGLETTRFERNGGLDAKVNAREFRTAVGHLRAAGFRADQVGAYLLAGLPEQSLAALAESIAQVRASRITPIATYYSPIPGTRLWPAAAAASRYDLAADPIYTNNAVLPCRPEPFDWGYITTVKRLVAGE